MRAAVTDLLSFGPNILPFLVKELGHETDSLRLYRLVLLLNAVAGINLYYDSGLQNVYDGSPQLRDRFIKDWDSGKFLNATQLLRDTWQKDHPVTTSGRIDPRKLIQVRRYGVFAIPFIIENIESTNSPELFAAFLIITGNSDLYAEYLENPSKHFSSRDQKLSSIKSWVSKNEEKMDKLKGLHDQIRTLAANPVKKAKMPIANHFVLLRLLVALRAEVAAHDHDLLNRVWIQRFTPRRTLRVIDSPRVESTIAL